MAIRSIFARVDQNERTQVMLAALKNCKTVQDYDRVYRDASNWCSFCMNSLQPGEDVFTHESGRIKAGDTLVQLENFDRQHRPALAKKYLAEYGVVQNKAMADIQKYSELAAKQAVKLIAASQKVIDVQKEVIAMSQVVEQLAVGGTYQTPPIHKNVQTPFGPLQNGNRREQSEQIAKTLVTRAALDMPEHDMLKREV